MVRGESNDVNDGPDEEADGSSALWGGRFQRGPHPEMIALTSSIDTDIRLLPHDVAATKAHARVLVKAGLLDAGDLDAIDDVCDELVGRWRRGELVPAPGDEDVHTLVERTLTEKLGEIGKRIHAGRSRNDLVATDLRLWCKDAAGRAIDLLGELIQTIASFAGAHKETVMPGYTHLQRAQPVSLAFHMLAHGFALVRDVERFRAAHAAADVSALGAGALAGNTLELDPSIAAGELGFEDVFANAMDAVSDRDFASDLLYASALCGVHLSRLAEELVMWTSSEFGFARIADDWSTGSSMMPQKRNPDVAELVRGRAAGGISDLNGLLVLLKGLPLAYDRDLQEDKEYVFRALDRIESSIVAMTRLLGALRLDKDRMVRAATGGAAWATDLAEALVIRGVPFRDAHEAVGGLVADLESQGVALADAPPELLARHHPLLRPSDRAAADPLASLKGRSSPGGAAPERVDEQIAALMHTLGAVRSPR
jgi:argininosuccinate lyase